MFESFGPFCAGFSPVPFLSVIDGATSFLTYVRPTFSASLLRTNVGHCCPPFAWGSTRASCGFLILSPQCLSVCAGSHIWSAPCSCSLLSSVFVWVSPSQSFSVGVFCCSCLQADFFLTICPVVSLSCVLGFADEA